MDRYYSCGYINVKLGQLETQDRATSETHIASSTQTDEQAWTWRRSRSDEEQRGEVKGFICICLIGMRRKSHTTGKEGALF